MSRTIKCPTCNGDISFSVDGQVIGLVSQNINNNIKYDKIEESICKTCKKSYFVLVQSFNYCPVSNCTAGIRISHIPEDHRIIGFFTRKEDIPPSLKYDGYFPSTCFSNHKFILLTRVANYGISNRDGQIDF